MKFFAHILNFDFYRVYYILFYFIILVLQIFVPRKPKDLFLLK